MSVIGVMVILGLIALGMQSCGLLPRWLCHRELLGYAALLLYVAIT
jgi:hypothetical protein